MHSRFRPSPAMLVALIALFVALGGSAAALSGSNTVQSDDLGPGSQVTAPDVAANAVNGSDVVDNSLLGADVANLGSGDITNASLGLADLNATSRPHKLEFSVPTGTGKTPISTVGHLLVSGTCVDLFSASTLIIYLKNTSAVAGTTNALIANDLAATGTTPVDVYTVGQGIGAGAEVTLDRDDSSADGVLANHASFHRVEGQVVFQTPGRVTTIDFHGFVGGGRCEFYGTAVTSNLS